MHRRPLSGIRFSRASGRHREDVGDVERPREELRVSRHVRFEEIDASPMQRHDRSVGRLKAVLDVHLENAMLCFGLTAVSAKQVLHRVGVHTVRPINANAQRKQDGRAFHIQRICGTGERPRIQRRPPRHLVNHPDRSARVHAAMLDCP